MNAQSIAARAARLLPALLLAACGLAGVRRSQDWSAADDPLLALACHVGGYGSGVLVGCDGTGATVLTCAHLAEGGDDVDVHFHDPRSGEWVTYEGEVLRATHPHKEDLAEIRIRTESFHLPPRTTPLADPFAAGEEPQVVVVNVAFGAEERPLLLTLPAFGTNVAVETVVADASGSTTWRIDKVIVHGGLTQANSGSPVFRDGRLVGLVESAPAIGTSPGGAMVGGVLVSAPQSLRTFLGR